MFPLLLLGIVGQCFGYYKQREEHKASKLKIAVGLSNRVERIPVWEYHKKRYFRDLNLALQALQTQIIRTVSLYDSQLALGHVQSLAHFSRGK